MMEGADSAARKHLHKRQIRTLLGAGMPALAFGLTFFVMFDASASGVSSRQADQNAGSPSRSELRKYAKEAAWW